MTIKVSVTAWVTVETDDEDKALSLAREKAQEYPPTFFDGATWDALAIEEKR